DGGPGVQIAFPAAVHRRVADHQRRRLRGPELHGVILSGLSEQDVCLFSACPVRGVGDHVVACEQRRQPAAVATIDGCSACMSLIEPLRAAARTWQESPRARKVSARGPRILEDPVHKTLLLSINALCASIVWAQAPAAA